MRALTAEQARAIEERAVAEQGVSLASLMRAAGAAVAAEVAARVPEGEIVVLAGPGNNGGDGWVAAHDLHASGRAVRVLSMRDPRRAVGNRGRCGARRDRRRRALARRRDAPLAIGDLADAAVIVDALLGIGASGALRAPLDAWVARAANDSGAYVVAVDVPTGIDADTGAVPGEAIRADCTVTFTAPSGGWSSTRRPRSLVRSSSPTSASTRASRASSERPSCGPPRSTPRSCRCRPPTRTRTRAAGCS